MTDRENLLRTVRFETPEFIPVKFAVNAACWHHYPQDELEDLMADHSMLFPGFKKNPEGYLPAYSPWQRSGESYTDPWHCVWETPDDGITGAVTQHPLASWDALDTFEPPDPEQTLGWGSLNWNAIERSMRNAESSGRLKRGSLRHGHTFLTLSYVRGYENLIMDMADGEPKLNKLIGLVEGFNQALVSRYVAAGVEWMGYPEDLGMQIGPMLSPDHFRQYIKPVFQRLIAPAREAGCVIHMHSDGDIRELAEDLVDCGLDILNLQDLVNGLDWIRDHFKGRVAIDLDIDRQQITRFGNPDQVDALILEAVQKLGSREGGLTMVYGLYPGIPLANVRALMDALEKYATYYS